LLICLFDWVGVSAAARYSLVDLGALPDCLESRPTAINNRGQVVGWAETTQGFCQAFLWDNGVMRNLNNVGGFQDIACDINDHGQIIATGMIHRRRRACLLNPKNLQSVPRATPAAQIGPWTTYRPSATSTAPITAPAQFQLRSFEVLSQGDFLLVFMGAQGSQYSIEASTNLTDWFPIGTASGSNGWFRFVDTDRSNFNLRFYRAVLPP